MKQLTVISGKGGTGKTTITGAFASLADNAVLADCDADAPDLQLLLTPDVEYEEDYVGSATAVKVKDCSMCGKCKEICRFNAIDDDFKVIETKCEGCGACAFACPEDAIEMRDEITGTIYTSLKRGSVPWFTRNSKSAKKLPAKWLPRLGKRLRRWREKTIGW